MTPAETWAAVRENFTFLFGQRAPVFIGCVLSCPLNPVIRDKFSLVPATWIHGPEKSGKTALGQDIHYLYTVHAKDPVDFCYLFTTAQVIARHAAFPHNPLYLDGEWDEGHGFSDLLTLSLDAGWVPTGLYGTINYGLKRINPTVRASPACSFHEELRLRFLHFPMDPEKFNSPENEARHSRNIANHFFYHLVLADLMATTGRTAWQATALRMMDSMERTLGTAQPKLRIRRRLQLAAAWGVYAAAATHFADTASLPDEEQWLLSHPLAFEANNKPL